MDFIEKLHRHGLNISEMLRLINADIGETTNGKIDSNVIKRCRREITLSNAPYPYFVSSFNYAAMLSNLMQIDKEFIKSMEHILLKALCDWGVERGFVAFGYRSIDEPYPVAIPIHEWNFLKVDAENNTAYCEDRKYKNVRFVLSTELKRLPTDEFNQLNILVNKKPELENNTVAEQELNTEQTKEFEIKLENVQEQSKNKQPNPRKSRKDNLTKAILAACESFGKKPSFDELWRYFQEDKDKTGFIDDFKDTHLTWLDTKGKLQDTQKESVANRLSRINYP
jgi:hypothetical protein